MSLHQELKLKNRWGSIVQNATSNTWGQKHTISKMKWRVTIAHKRLSHIIREECEKITKNQISKMDTIFLSHKISLI